MIPVSLSLMPQNFSIKTSHATQESSKQADTNTPTTAPTIFPTSPPTRLLILQHPYPTNPV